MLTITTTHSPATDLGYLLHKHPDRLQTFDVNFGKAHFFYPEANPERCTAAMFLDIDPINLTPRGNKSGVTPPSLLQDYINDRPYTASSHLSVAIAKVLGTAMTGKCTERPELVQTPIPLRATIASVHSRYGPDLIRRLFEPLGYSVETETPLLDPEFPDWGDSYYHNITLSSDKSTLSQLLTHLYVLLPALDNQKHYWINQDETDKLLRMGEGWLESHPAKEVITMRYLGHRRSLYERAQNQLAPEQPEEPDEDEETPGAPEGPEALEQQQETAEVPVQQEKPAAKQTTEEDLERPAKLQDLRIQAVIETLHAADATSVIDLGCGDGDLMVQLAQEPLFTSITGVEVSYRSLSKTRRRLNISRNTSHRDRDRNQNQNQEQDQRLKVIQGSLTYRDPRLQGADAAVAMEVVEHLDPSKLDAFEDAVLQTAHPGCLIVTTPNREYNELYGIPEDQLRHRDHRFEWTRQEFQMWAQSAADKHGYRVSHRGIGPESQDHGQPTQMAVFTLLTGDTPA